MGFLTGESEPVELSFSPRLPTKVRFSNGDVSDSVCVCCPDAPCMFYRAEENIVSELPSFPSNESPRVCPTDAIVRPDSKSYPQVDQDRCIWCGVCVARCPVGAIRLEAKAGAVIQQEDQPGFTRGTDMARHDATRSILAALPRSGVALSESDMLLDRIQYRLVTNLEGSDEFSNVLARNLMRAVGSRVAMRRIGNNHMRMDLIWSFSANVKGVVEVELRDTGLLDVSRDLLDDIAVLAERYGWQANRTTPVVIPLYLPNRRADYWGVVEDVRKVLGVRIQTIPLLLLMIKSWEFSKLDPSSPSLHVDRTSESIRTNLFNKPLGRELNLSNSLSRLVEPDK